MVSASSRSKDRRQRRHQSTAVVSDSIPLNKSFETQETSDTYGTADASHTSQANVMAVWGLHHDGYLEKSARGKDQRQERRKSFSSSETEKVKNTAKKGTILTEAYRSDTTTHYSPSLDIMFESVGGEDMIFCSEPEPRASVHPVPHALQQTVEFFGDEGIEPTCAIWDQWNGNNRAFKSGKIEDAVGGAVLCTEYAPKLQNPIVVNDPRVVLGIEEARTPAHLTLQRTNQHEDDYDVARTYSSCVENRRKRRAICAVLAVVIVLFLGGAVIAIVAAGNKLEDAATASPQNDSESIWIGDRPENKPTEKPHTTATQYPTATPLPSTNDTQLQGTQVQTGSPQTPAPLPPTVASPASTSPPTHAPVAPIRVTEAPTPQPQLRPSNPPTIYPTAQPQVRSTNPPTIHPTTHPTPLGTILPFATLAPLVSAAAAPTIAAPVAPPQPTNSPTCRSTITVNNICFLGWLDDVIVDFVNCNPQDDDWVGIWPEGEDPSNLSENYVDWAWSCGTQSCLGAPNANRVVFEKNRLPLGTFRVYLLPEMSTEGPYFSNTMSQPFLITNHCGFR